MYTDLELVIGSQRIGAADRHCSDVLNPATGEVIARLPRATKADLDTALEISVQAFKTWRRRLAVDRGELRHGILAPGPLWWSEGKRRGF